MSAEVKSGYKQTEAGLIPEDWEARSLLSVVRLANGQVDPTVEPYKSMPLIAPDHIESGTGTLLKIQTAEEQGAISGKYFFSSGDIIYSKIRPYLKKVVHVDFDGLCSADMYPMTPLTGISANFVLPVLLGHRFSSYAETVSVRSGMPKINREELACFSIPLPPAEEQVRIGITLSDMDALISSLDQLIAKKRDIRQATMQQLLTGQRRLPGFSDKWEMKRLGDVASLNRFNIIPFATPDKTFVHFSLPAFDEGKRPVREPGAAIGSNKFSVPANAILVSKLNPRIPRVWLPQDIPTNAVASTEFLVLTPRDGVTREFLYVVCKSSSFCAQMELAATGTTGSHQRISPSSALGLSVNVPSEKSEQSAIATILFDMDTEIASLESRLEKTRQLKQGMMQELLTGRVRLV